jgi:glycerol-3-phosphate acyltransferase PlsY
MLALILCVIGYLLGSLSSAIIMCKLLKLPDPRTVGSGNAGATNILRISGKKEAIIVLIADMLKGTLAVLFARLFLSETLGLAMVGCAAFLGHIFPVFFKFKGGKGVATLMGVILGLAPLLALVLAIIWATVAFVSRYSSLASIVIAVALPILGLFLAPHVYCLAFLIMTIIILFKHQENIARLLAGTENKIGYKF